jgi:hypothetical protein
VHGDYQAGLIPRTEHQAAPGERSDLFCPVDQQEFMRGGAGQHLTNEPACLPAGVAPELQPARRAAGPGQAILEVLEERRLSAAFGADDRSAKLHSVQPVQNLFPTDADGAIAKGVDPFDAEGIVAGAEADPL